MRTPTAVLTFILLLALLNATAGAPAGGPQTVQMAKHLKLRKTERFSVDYLLFLPKGYQSQPQKRWPLIFFLHGAGERGTNVWEVAVHGPPKHVVEDPDFPFIVVSPQCPEGQIWSAAPLLALLDEVMRKYAVDPGRVYLTGLSMGGYGTWDLGLAYPEKFAAIVPICGGGELIKLLLASGEKGRALKTLGVWAFHGGKDPIVPPQESQRMVDWLKKSGVKDVQLTIYPDAGHDAWTETYKNPELYQWLLRHERSKSG